MRPQPVEGDTKHPLVSIIVYNYNYGRFLRECLDSAFAQTYPNVEICFSDNASTDDSWAIALEYMQKFPGIMTVTQNRRNFGSDANFANCWHCVRGKYMVTLCSDDALAPRFVEKCLFALENHKECGFAMVHRMIIDQNGEYQEEAPFYNKSCIIPGADQAAVYMMAAVNPSISQVMYSMKRLAGNMGVGGIASRWYSNRIMDFNLCRENALAYISEPLLLHRIHNANDSSKAAENLLEIIGPFVLQHQFAEIAKASRMDKAAARLPKAVEKLGQLCLRYCMRFLQAGNDLTARRYFHLALAIHPGLEGDPLHLQLQRYFIADLGERPQILEILARTANLANRTESYDPPESSRAIDWGLFQEQATGLVG